MSEGGSSVGVVDGPLGPATAPADLVAAGGRGTDGRCIDYTFNRPDPLHIGVCGTNGVLHDAVMGLMQPR